MLTPIKKIFFLFSILILAQKFVQAQAVQTKEPNYRDPVLDRQSGIIAEVKAKPAGVEGTSYLNEAWNVGNIYLKSGDTLKNYPLKFDIGKSMIEIQTPQGVKILAGDKITRFNWHSITGDSVSTFVNADMYSFDGTKLTGFYQVLVVGPLSLFARTSLEVLKSNYNAALDVGNKADKIVKKEKLYVATDKKVVELKTKDDFSLFGDKEAAVKAYAKSNRLKMSRREDATKLITYFNSI